jgi:hypothetical protein
MKPLRNVTVTIPAQVSMGLLEGEIVGLSTAGYLPYSTEKSIELNPVRPLIHRRGGVPVVDF